MPAAIVGVAESDLGITGKSTYQLIAQASLAALEDAGLRLSDVDGLATTGSSRFPATQVAEYLGIAPSWVDTTFIGGASFESFVGHATAAIDAGLCEVVLVSFGSNQRSTRSRRLGGVVESATPEAQYEAPCGPLNPISAYALVAQRYLHEYRATSEQLAEVAVAAREWAMLNPKAYRHDDGPLTVEDVLASPLLSTPLRALDCCLVTDGGGAVVIASEERASELRRPIRILGSAETTTHQGIASMPDLLATGAVETSRAALGRADLDIGDVDVFQIYDSFTITVVLTLEALGICERGEAAAFIADGRTRPGGSLSLNTSGGGLSYCHPGMFGIFLLIEAVRQLRGEAGLRQVTRHETALCHGTGGIFSTHSTVVLAG